MTAHTETHFATLEPENLSWSARWASIAIRDQLADIQKGIKALPTPGEIEGVIPRNQLAPVADTRFHPEGKSESRTYKIGIIGAGSAGLFAGLIFDHLRAKYGLNVEYDILESNGKERLGGRLYSHYFKDVEDPTPHDYYDVGAMRFPDSTIMKRVYALFEKELKMRKTEDTLFASSGDLVPYYLQGRNTTELYNDIQITNPEGSTSTADSFKVTGLPPNVAGEQPSRLIEQQIEAFTSRLQKNPKEAWDYLLEKGDAYSVRQWFMKKLDFNTTEWLETYSYGTSWYDEALTEMILEDMNFSDKCKWYCVMGGAQEIARRMYTKIEAKKAYRVSFDKKVTKMNRLVTTQNTKGDGQVPQGPKISVEVEGEGEPRAYDAVFNSAPLGNMQRMDLRGLNLNWGTKQAIRSLGYGASCKVGIRFKRLWWKELGITQGGVSKTDQPIRMCVYPSYNIDDPTDKPGVLLCSYSWSQEAQRIGSLITSSSPDGEAELKTLLIDNLAKLHSNTPQEYAGLKKIIEDTYETHYAYDWYADRGTTGAFAYFGPGQFQNMYPYIVRNDGVHIIIGEAASAHHAWVVGALESAVRGVYQFLYHNSKTDPKVNEVLQAYNENKVDAPYGPVPAEFDRTTDVLPLGAEGDVKRVNATGEWLRQGVLAEEIRLSQRGDRLDPTKVRKEQVEEFLRVQI